MCSGWGERNASWKGMGLSRPLNKYWFWTPCPSLYTLFSFILLLLPFSLLPGCGANFWRVEVCPSSFTSLPEDSPTSLVTPLLLLQTFSIPLTRNYLKFLPGRPRRFHIQKCPGSWTTQREALPMSSPSGHFTLLQGTPFLELLDPKFSRTHSTDKQSHIQSSCSCHQAGWLSPPVLPPDDRTQA